MNKKRGKYREYKWVKERIQREWKKIESYD